MAFTTPVVPGIGQLIGDGSGGSFNWSTQVTDNLTFLHGPPKCRAYNSVDTSITTNAHTALLFNSERFDTNTMHSTSSNTGRITFMTAGTYLVGCNVEFAGNASGYRQVRIRLNGTTYIADALQVAVSAVEHTLILSAPYTFAASDYIEVVVFQNSGGALNVTSRSQTSPEFWALWVAA